MPTFRSSDGLEIAHYSWGEPGPQPPVVLQHGFIGTARGNWELPGIVGALVAEEADSMHAEPIDLAAITAPTLVLAGDADTLVERPERLAAAIPGATLRIVPGDHMGAVGAPEFRAALVDFFR